MTLAEARSTFSRTTITCSTSTSTSSYMHISLVSITGHYSRNEFDSEHVPFMYIDHLQFDLNFV